LIPEEKSALDYSNAQLKALSGTIQISLLNFLTHTPHEQSLKNSRHTNNDKLALGSATTSL
jgi:hypothetical protein